MKRTIALPILVIATLLFGTAFAYGYGFWGGGLHDFNMNFNRTYNATDIKEELNLPSNATMMDIRNAVIQKQQDERNQLLIRVKQKLGLSNSANETELNTALNSWINQNKDILQAINMHDKFGSPDRFDFPGRFGFPGRFR